MSPKTLKSGRMKYCNYSTDRSIEYVIIVPPLKSVFFGRNGELWFKNLVVNKMGLCTFWITCSQQICSHISSLKIYILLIAEFVLNCNKYVVCLPILQQRYFMTENVDLWLKNLVVNKSLYIFLTQCSQLKRPRVSS